MNKFRLTSCIVIALGVQSSTPLSQLPGKKEEDWRQEGHRAIKEVAPKPPCMKLTWGECIRQVPWIGHWRERVGGA